MTTRVRIGEPFEGLEVESDTPNEHTVKLIQATAQLEDSRTRKSLTIGAIGFCMLIVLIAGVIGIIDGTFNEVQAVYNVIGPVTAVIFGYYFGARRTDRNDETK
ncbi:MAG: hypothetical protein AAFR65_07495 [Pseudomonadota bacterium]